MSEKLNLVLHCGGRQADRQEVLDSFTPPAADGWHPIPHGTLLEGVQDTLAAGGLHVVAEAHGLARDNQQYFGMLQVKNGDDGEGDYGVVIGVRNSHDKSFAASLALGSGVFVCDNLAFSGEVKLARKHTRFIQRDLPALTHKAVGLLAAHRKGQDMRIAAYKDHELNDPQAHDVLINALDARVIPASKLPAVLKEWREPRHPEFAPRTAWSLFNSFTEVLKGNATLCLPRTRTLHGMMDTVCGLVS